MMGVPEGVSDFSGQRQPSHHMVGSGGGSEEGIVKGAGQPGANPPDEKGAVDVTKLGLKFSTDQRESKKPTDSTDSQENEQRSSTSTSQYSVLDVTHPSSADPKESKGSMDLPDSRENEPRSGIDVTHPKSTVAEEAKDSKGVADSSVNERRSPTTNSQSSMVDVSGTSSEDSEDSKDPTDMQEHVGRHSPASAQVSMVDVNGTSSEDSSENEPHYSRNSQVSMVDVDDTNSEDSEPSTVTRGLQEQVGRPSLASSQSMVRTSNFRLRRLSAITRGPPSPEDDAPTAGVGGLLCLALLPLLTSLKSLLFKVVSEHNDDINPISPILVAQATLTVVIFAYITVRHGPEEAVQSFSRRYIIFALYGAIGTILNAASFLALEGSLAPALQLILMKTSVFWASLLQICQQGPDAFDVRMFVTLVAVMSPVSIYALGGDGDDTAPIAGVVWALVAALADVLTDAVQEALMVAFKRAAKEANLNEAAETARCFWACTFWSMVFALVLSFGRQAFIEGGLDTLSVFRGWSTEVFFCCAFPMTVRWPVMALSVFWFGPLRVNLVGCFDCAWTYGLQCCIGLSELTVKGTLQVVAIVSVVSKNEMDRQHVEDMVLQARQTCVDDLVCESALARAARASWYIEDPTSARRDSTNDST